MDFILQFNTSLPVRVLLMCWGPYVIMCVYACFDNVKLISPKLRMVCIYFVLCNLTLCENETVKHLFLIIIVDF